MPTMLYDTSTSILSDRAHMLRLLREPLLSYPVMLPKSSPLSKNHWAAVLLRTGLA